MKSLLDLHLEGIALPYGTVIRFRGGKKLYRLVEDIPSICRIKLEPNTTITFKGLKDDTREFTGKLSAMIRKQDIPNTLQDVYDAGFRVKPNILMEDAYGKKLYRMVGHPKVFGKEVACRVHEEGYPGQILHHMSGDQFFVKESDTLIPSCKPLLEGHIPPGAYTVMMDEVNVLPKEIHVLMQRLRTNNELKFYYNHKKHSAYMVTTTTNINGKRIETKRTEVKKSKDDSPDIKYAFLYAHARHMSKLSKTQLKKQIDSVMAPFNYTNKQTVMGVLMSMYFKDTPFSTREKAIDFINESMDDVKNQQSKETKRKAAKQAKKDAKKKARKQD